MSHSEIMLLWAIFGLVQAILTARYWEVDKADDAFWCVFVLTFIAPIVSACWGIYAVFRFIAWSVLTPIGSKK